MRHILLIVFGCIYFILFTLKKNEIFIPIASSYLADVLSVPIIALLMEKIMKYLYEVFNMQVKHLLVIPVALIFIFEILLPRYSPNYVADHLDSLSYCLGTLFTIVVLYDFKTKKAITE